MGIDISNSLIVGSNYSELESWIEAKIQESENEDYDRYEVVEEYFDYASPYYDAGIEDQFFGFQIPNYQPLDDEWWEIVKEAAHQFELLTGIKAKIRGGAHVW